MIIAGPGMVKATQQALDKKAVLSIVQDTDIEGNLVRIGYFLEKDNNRLSNPEITWFDSSEIEIKIIFIDSQEQPLNEGKLELKHSHQDIDDYKFLIKIPLINNHYLYLRNILRLNKQDRLSFTIQVELKMRVKDRPNNIYPLARYDCAHGSIHRDLMIPIGNKSKWDLPTQNTKEAISFAIDDLLENFGNWIEGLEGVQIEPKIINDRDIRLEIEKARTSLIDLINKPHLLQKTSSRLTEFTSI